MATATAYSTQLCSTYTSHNYNKNYLLFALPSLGTYYSISAATLDLYSQADLSGSMTVTANTSNANNAWISTTAAATLNAYALDAGSTSITEDFAGAYANTTVHWNIMGYAGVWGVTHAYSLGLNTCTVILTNSIYTTAGTSTSNSVLINGNNSSSTDANFLYGIGVGTHYPTLTITYTAVSPTLPIYSNIINGSSVGGMY